MPTFLQILSIGYSSTNISSRWICSTMLKSYRKTQQVQFGQWNWSDFIQTDQVKKTLCDELDIEAFDIDSFVLEEVHSHDSYKEANCYFIQLVEFILPSLQNLFCNHLWRSHLLASSISILFLGCPQDLWCNLMIHIPAKSF